MSTRVHELAKDLGLKSQELLDRIQKWGLDVKASALASLDPSTVDRIKELMESSSAEPAATTPSSVTAPAVPVTPKPVPRTFPSETSPISASATAESRHSTGPAPRPSGPAPSSTPPSPAPTTPATATSSGNLPPRVTTVVPPAPRAAPLAATPSAPLLAQPPVSHPKPSSTPIASPPPAESAVPPTRPAGGLNTPPAAAPGPLSRHGSLSSSPRAGGPLSGHTPHRATTGGPARPASPPSPQQDYRPNPSTPPPLKRSDYISSAGIRQPVRPGMTPQGGQQSLRRPVEESPGGAGSGAKRPLPSVAAPMNPPPQARRSGSGPPGRSGNGGQAPAPEVKTQRPEKRFSPEELRAMMLSGQLGGQAQTAPSGLRSGPTGRLGAGPANLRGPSGPTSGSRMGSPAGPALRRPATGPAPAAPAPPMTTAEEEERKGGAGRLGTPADRAGRRARRNERATERRVTSPVPASALLNETDEESRKRRGGRKPKGGHRAALAPTRKAHAQIEPPISLRSLSEAIGVRANDLIKRMMTNMGQLVSINASLDDESAQMLALEFGVELEVVHERTAEDDMIDAFEPEEASSELLVHRPPVITILGHVDHGKTSLLDKIRKANVVATESGGITQHIGAYQVEHGGKQITFVDTPGHEAFTGMRARGANVTDIVVLVVAADDGVMPQTKEAIDHAKAADVPIVVALNKIDLPNVDTPANINKIYGELAQQGLNPVEWGGNTEVIRTSTFTGQGLDDLLATLDIIAEMNELKANPGRPGKGTCLEASISEGRGVVATVLVQDGTLRVGDSLVCGDGFGRVRALFNDKGVSVTEAGPSTPVEVSGLDAVPTAGEKFAVVDDIALAREIAEARRVRSRGVNLGERQTITLENLYSKMAEQKIKSLNLILKADVQGSLEALLKELEKLENDEVPVRVLLKGVGGISESDILLADASQAIVIGFRVAPEDRAVTLADEKKIEIRRYDIIYQVTDEIKKAIEGMLVPEYKEVHLGRANVRQVFKISKVGAIAGCFVTQGTIERGSKARLYREGREVYKGTIEALKRFKDDVREVREGFECGIKISNFDDLKPDDQIESYRIDEIRRTL